MKFVSSTVRWFDMHPMIEAAKDLVDAVFQDVAKRELIVTAARNGNHTPGSLHYVGRAFDGRSYDLAVQVQLAAHRRLVEALGSEWDVLLYFKSKPSGVELPRNVIVDPKKDPHYHIEFDPFYLKARA